jgi:hypothetical protein
MTRFNFYSPVHFEKWDWRNSVEKGIGGSETSHVEMAWRLAARGYEVVNYAPIPRDCPGTWRNTKWFPLEKVDFKAPGIWVIYRDASCIDQIPKTSDQQVWLMCQDESAVNITAERVAKMDRVITLCEWHRRHVEHGLLRGKVCVGSNGVKLELIREVEKEKIERNPHRLMYASSPDRGLLPLLKIFKRAKEFVSDLELHVFYGVDNIKKLIKHNPRFNHYEEFVKELMQAIKQPGVFWHGRVDQKTLYKSG